VPASASSHVNDSTPNVTPDAIMQKRQILCINATVLDLSNTGLSFSDVIFNSNIFVAS
jgi:hypothetical protein